MGRRGCCAWLRRGRPWRGPGDGSRRAWRAGSCGRTARGGRRRGSRSRGGRREGRAWGAGGGGGVAGAQGSRTEWGGYGTEARSEEEDGQEASAGKYSAEEGKGSADGRADG